MQFKEILISVIELLSKLSGGSPSGNLLLDEYKRLKAENISLKLENKILRGHHAIEKKFNDMSDPEFDDFIKRKFPDNSNK